MGLEAVFPMFYCKHFNVGLSVVYRYIEVSDQMFVWNTHMHIHPQMSCPWQGPDIQNIFLWGPLYPLRPGLHFEIVKYRQVFSSKLENTCTVKKVKKLHMLNVDFLKVSKWVRDKMRNQATACEISKTNFQGVRSCCHGPCCLPESPDPRFEITMKTRPSKMAPHRLGVFLTCSRSDKY